MLRTAFGILFLMVTGLKGETWQLPTAADIETSLEACQITNVQFLNPAGNHNTISSDSNSDLRCFSRKLGLWSDDEGFMGKRFVKLLNKNRQPVEISIVIDYCNKSRKQIDLDKWANDAFNCFARGPMGRWISEYVKNLYKKKVTN